MAAATCGQRRRMDALRGGWAVPHRQSYSTLDQRRRHRLAVRGHSCRRLRLCCRGSHWRRGGGRGPALHPCRQCGGGRASSLSQRSRSFLLCHRQLGRPRRCGFLGLGQRRAGRGQPIPTPTTISSPRGSSLLWISNRRVAERFRAHGRDEGEGVSRPCHLGRRGRWRSGVRFCRFSCTGSSWLWRRLRRPRGRRRGACVCPRTITCDPSSFCRHGGSLWQPRRLTYYPSACPDGGTLRRTGRQNQRGDQPPHRGTEQQRGRQTTTCRSSPTSSGAQEGSTRCARKEEGHFWRRQRQRASGGRRHSQWCTRSCWRPKADGALPTGHGEALPGRRQRLTTPSGQHRPDPDPASRTDCFDDRARDRHADRPSSSTTLTRKQSHSWSLSKARRQGPASRTECFDTPAGQGNDSGPARGAPPNTINPLDRGCYETWWSTPYFGRCEGGSNVPNQERGPCCPGDIFCPPRHLDSSRVLRLANLGAFKPPTWPS